MAMTAADYLAQEQALLPQGAAWPRDSDATLTKLLNAFADELARIDGRALTLIEEADPRTTNELLGDWERVAGLPDTCVAATLSTAQRIAALVTKLTTLGGQTRDYYIALAAKLGYTITITEFAPYTVASPVNAAIYGELWRFAWQVNSSLVTQTFFTMSSTVADALSSFGNDQLECVMSRLKPAHTHVQFAYT